MANLQQSSTSDTLYIGWYGTCPENQGESDSGGICDPFTLVESSDGSNSPLSWRHSIFPETLSDPPSPANGFAIGQSEFFRSVKEVNNLSGALTAYDGTGTTPFGLAGSQIKELVCGRCYYITLKPGNKTLDIPEFQFANQATSSYQYRVAETCAPVTELEKLWISFTGNGHYSDWYELETDEVDNFTKFKIKTPNYGTDLYNWAKDKTTNLQGINITESLDKPSNTSLTETQQQKTFNSSLLSFSCNSVFNKDHGINTGQINLRAQAYNNQNTSSLKKYGSDDSTHGYLASGKPWAGSNMVFRTTVFNSIVIDDSGKNSIDIDYFYFIYETDEDKKIKFSDFGNSICGVS